MSTYLSVVPRAERQSHAQRNPSPSPYSPSPVRFGNCDSAFVRRATSPSSLTKSAGSMRTRHYSLRTEKAYMHWIKRFIFFHGKRHPREMGEIEIGQFLSALATESQVSASTQNQALNALLFLYRAVLEQPVGYINGVVRAKRPHRLPVVLTRQEVRAIVDGLEGVEWVMVTLLYGAGLRLMECLRLRVQEIDFGTIRLPCAPGKVTRIA